MGKRQVQAEKTRRKILEAAKKLLDEKGIDKLNIRDIVNEAGVATGSFYTYFDRKEDILETIAFEYLDQITNESIATGNDLFEKISNYLEGLTEIIYDSGVSNCRLWFKQGLDPEHSKIIINKMYSDLVGLKVLFQTAQKEGELKKDINIKEYAEIILTSLYGVLLIWCIAEEFNPLGLIEKYCNTELKDLIEDITI